MIPSFFYVKIKCVIAYEMMEKILEITERKRGGYLYLKSSMIEKNVEDAE